MKERDKYDSRTEIKIAEDIIKRILDLFDITGSIEIRRRQEGTILDIQGCSNPGRLIGQKGITLQSIQHIVTLIVCRKVEKPTDIIIDVNGYRERRRMELVDMAWRAFDKVIKTGRSVILKPMNSADRRIIHETLSNEPDIETYSIDEDPETGMKSVQISIRGEEQSDIESEDVFEDDFIEEEEYYEDYPEEENLN